MISEHSLQQNNEQLWMYLVGGPGGTSKSSIINVLRKFFIHQGQESRFLSCIIYRCCCKNNQRHDNSLNTCIESMKKGKHTIQNKQWSPVHLGRGGLSFHWWSFYDRMYLIIQYQWGFNWCEREHLFFWRNQCDFCWRLCAASSSWWYMSLCKYRHVSNQILFEACMYGKLLWLSINTVVILSEIMRQSGPENKNFVDLLGRLTMTFFLAKSWIKFGMNGAMLQ